MKHVKEKQRDDSQLRYKFSLAATTSLILIHTTHQQTDGNTSDDVGFVHVDAAGQQTDRQTVGLQTQIQKDENYELSAPSVPVCNSFQ